MSRHRPLEKQPTTDVSAAPARALSTPRGDWASRGDRERCAGRTLRSSTLSATSAAAARAKKVAKARPSTDIEYSSEGARAARCPGRSGWRRARMRRHVTSRSMRDGPPRPTSGRSASAEYGVRAHRSTSSRTCEKEDAGEEENDERKKKQKTKQHRLREGTETSATRRGHTTRASRGARAAPRTAAQKDAPARAAQSREGAARRAARAPSAAPSARGARACAARSARRSRPEGHRSPRHPSWRASAAFGQRRAWRSARARGTTLGTRARSAAQTTTS